jgi:hypothetical protein
MKAPEERQRRYLRKKQLRVRYGYESDRSIERAVADGYIPKPDLFMGRFPLWAEDALDAHDARAARAQTTRRRNSFRASKTAVPARPPRRRRARRDQTKSRDH